MNDKSFSNAVPQNNFIIIELNCFICSTAIKLKKNFIMLLFVQELRHHTIFAVHKKKIILMTFVLESIDLTRKLQRAN